MGLNAHILTITEPTIKLDKLEFESFGEEEYDKSANTSKGSRYMEKTRKKRF